MFCENCGMEIKNDSTFCEFCGAVQEEDVEGAPNPIEPPSDIPQAETALRKIEAPKQAGKLTTFTQPTQKIGAEKNSEG